MGVTPGCKQTELGLIPEDWELLPVSAFGDVVTGGTPPTKEKSYWGGEYPWVTPTDISNRRDICLSERGVSASGLNTLRSLPANSVLVTCIASIGKNAVLTAKGACNQQINAVIPNEGNVANFLYYLFENSKAYLLANAGITATNIVSKTVFKNLLFPVPPDKNEQQAIADALSDADALIASLEQLVVKKRDIKRGAMQELLTGKKRLPGFTGEWRTRQWGDVIVSCSSGATPYRGRPDYYKGTVKWITSGELNFNFIEDTIEHISQEAVERTNLKIHPPGTFLMAITGLEAAGTRGACGIVGSRATTNQSCMAVYPTGELKTPYLFHYYVLRGDELAFEYCQGTKQQSYTARLVKLLPIDMPPSVEEQAGIASVLTDMDSEIAVLEAKLAKARLLKQGMMQELLTGRIRLI